MKTALVCLTVLLFPFSTVKAQLNAYFVNVGQGDAAYFELPNGSNVLVDGGPSGAPIYEFLKSKNVTRIDHVVLTHPHSDHYRGLKKVFDAFEVRHFYDTRAENVDAAGDNNLRQLADAEPGCRTHFPEPGTNLDWDRNVTVKVLNSCTEKVLIHDNNENNNCSLVLRFYYNGTGILMMGDAEASIENAMMRIYKSGLQSTYLKVAHHGSRYSSTPQFLARVQPRVGIISVARDNVYGHPHKEALDRLKASGARLFFTWDGTQSLRIPAPKAGIDFVNQDPDFGEVTMTVPRFNIEERVQTGEESQALEQLRQQSR